MKDRSLSGPGVQVLLVGTGSYKSTIPDIPAVSNNLQDLGQVLIAKCGLNSSNLRLLTDPELPYIVGDAIIEAAERSTTVLLFYYVGHGFVSSNGDLYLSVAMTDRSPSRLPWTGIRYDSVRAALLNSRAQTTVVLLDCCFSGRAVEALAALSPEDVVADLTGVQGGYIMTASAPDELALAPAGEKYTAFTGELIRLLHDGSTECGRHITLAEVYQTISSRMRQRGMPVPRQRVSGTAGGLLFRENSAYVKGPTNNAVDPIYNSDDEWDTFRRDWGYFDSSGQYAGFFDLPGTAQMQSDGAGDVGLNKSVASLYGVVEFEFLVNSNSPTSSPVFFCAIPMKSGIDFEPLIEVGGQMPGDPRNSYSISRQRWYVPQEQYNDKQWHAGSIKFDFRDTPSARYTIFAPRINEGSLKKAAATVALRRVRIWDLMNGSQNFVDNAGWE